ncbi:hypothetical protein BDQ12DRAFT_681382 [Crucibulum laeve]|uniref:SUZ domain-containing protein n=1 Tax=Crucibulum laeve TaxID=68775 RepID=A0A5C3M3T8_9AGAR|nr:hypothetical protein BDQ12DRAFT_681382 [Crucibulum laeve]
MSQPYTNGVATPSSSTTSLLPPPTPPSLDSPSPSTDVFNIHSPPAAPLDANNVNGADTDNQQTNTALTQPTTPDVDPQILEALRSKDRLYVLKLGELMEGLITERRLRIDLSPSTSYQRLLVHRCLAYYKLAPENDPLSKGIIVLPTVDSRIPARRICELVPAESTAQPAFKIMRRSLPSDRRSKPQSQAGSVAGEDADLSDIEPSEAGSLGGRSNATGGSTKKRMTIEEREAAYNEARSRIFMDFEEKEKEKEKDMSASSSSLSVVSGSASTSGGGSVGDLDESVSSPATESEWSGPSTAAKEKKDNRRGGSAASSSRSLRSGAPPFHANGSGSSRNSRAPSPAFTYASLYEPPPQGALYDPLQHPGQQNVGYHQQQQYLYPYSPPGHPHNQPYVTPYPYYPTYNPYQSPPLQTSSDPSTPASADAHAHPQHMGYPGPYMWAHPNQQPMQSPPQMQQQPQQSPSQVITPTSGPQSPQYQHYAPQPHHSYTYPPGAYYPPPPQIHSAPPPMQQQQPMYDVLRVMNGNMANGSSNGHHMNNNHNPNQLGIGRPPLMNGIMSPNGNGNGSGRSSARSSAGSNGVHANGSGVNKGRNGGHIPPPARSAWSYGPGIGPGGYGAVNNHAAGGGDAVGPRLSNTRRMSGNSRASSNCDEASSVASSSTTSSSSRRTYTSTTSSQHPLPPRPDWAVGLKPQPTLASRHHDSLNNSRTMSPISPPRTLSGGGPSPHQSSQPQSPAVSLQSTDFPPLSSVTNAEKRAPVVAGAWGNSSSTRSILQANAPGNALINHGQNGRLEEPDRGFERPPPKSSQLFNPKIAPRPAANNGTANNGTAGGAKSPTEKEKDRARGDVVANAILVDQVASMSLDEQQNGTEGPFSVQREPTMVTPSS